MLPLMPREAVSLVTEAVRMLLNEWDERECSPSSVLVTEPIDGDGEGACAMSAGRVGVGAGAAGAGAAGADAAGADEHEPAVGLIATWWSVATRDECSFVQGEE